VTDLAFEINQYRPSRPMGISVRLAAQFGNQRLLQRFKQWAAERHGVSSEMLYAVARNESGLDLQAVGYNHNASRDIRLLTADTAFADPGGLSTAARDPAPALPRLSCNQW